MQYEISTPVNSDINTTQKKVQYSLAFSIKRSMLITQQSSTTFRIGSNRYLQDTSGMESYHNNIDTR